MTLTRAHSPGASLVPRHRIRRLRGDTCAIFAVPAPVRSTAASPLAQPWAQSGGWGAFTGTINTGPDFRIVPSSPLPRAMEIL